MLHNLEMGTYPGEGRESDSLVGSSLSSFSAVSVVSSISSLQALSTLLSTSRGHGVEPKIAKLIFLVNIHCV